MSELQELKIWFSLPGTNIPNSRLESFIACCVYGCSRFTLDGKTFRVRSVGETETSLYNDWEGIKSHCIIFSDTWYPNKLFCAEGRMVTENHAGHKKLKVERITVKEG